MADITVIGGLVFAAIVNLEVPPECTALIAWYERMKQRERVTVISSSYQRQHYEQSQCDVGFKPARGLFDAALTLRRGRGRSRGGAHQGITRTERTLSFKALRLM